MEVEALLCSSSSRLVPFRHGISQTRRTRDRSTFPLSLHLPACRFPLSIQKEKKRRGGYGAERAAPIPRFWVLTFFFFAFLAVVREKESERLGHIGLPRFFFTLLCVFGSMLIDGLHIPIVTSLRRLSTVGCGGMGAMCLKRTDGPYQSKGARGTADRIDTSPRDYYYYLAGQARHFGIATVVVRILGDGLEDQKWGVWWWEGPPEVLFDLYPGLRLFSGEGAQHEASRRRVY